MEFSFKRHFIYVTALSFLISCSLPSLGTLEQLPSWYISPKSFDNNLYGVGQGATIDEASKSALNNISSKLMVGISSESQSSIQSNQISSYQESSQKINEIVERITFNNYQITKSVYYSGQIYAEIAIDRQQFVQTQKENLNNLNQEMSSLYKKLGNKTILEKRNDLEFISQKSEKAKSINYILSGLGEIDSSILRKNLNIYQKYNSKYQNILNDIEFFIVKNNTPKSAINLIINSLNQEKLKVTKIRNKKNKNLVMLDIKSKILHKEIYGSHIAKVTLNFNLLSNQGNIINSKKIEISGSSVISQDEAVRSAIVLLSRKIKEETIATILLPAV